MREVSKEQIITIHTLLRQKGLYEEKARIVSEASGGRTSSCARLYFSEASNIINMLNGKKNEEDDKRQRMQRYIIAMANEMGWIRKEKQVLPGGDIKTKNNYTDLHSWIEKYGYLKKPLNRYTYQELPKLVTQFKAVYDDKMGFSNNQKP